MSVNLRNELAILGGRASSFLSDAEFLPCSWLVSADQQLKAIASVSSNWDGNNARAPNCQTVKSAVTLLKILADTVSMLPKPEINPTRNGGVQFEWTMGRAYLMLELTDESTLAYYYEDPDRNVDEDRSIPLGSSLDRILQILRTFRYI